MSARFVSCLVAAMVGFGVPSVSAQDGKSASLARELVTLLDAAKLDSIAVRDPASKEQFFGALYVPKLQLIVVAGTYAAPILLDTRIYRREYRDTYLDLQGASELTSRLIVEDMGADGLAQKRVESGTFDSVENGGKRTRLDGDWKKQKINEAEYMKTFAAADERYAQILDALIKEAKRPR